MPARKTHPCQNVTPVEFNSFTIIYSGPEVISNSIISTSREALKYYYKFGIIPIKLKYKSSLAPTPKNYSFFTLLMIIRPAV